jgi:hypothetical protein
MTVAITRLDLSAANLRQAAAGTQNAKIARWMLAIALILEEAPCGSGAELHGEPVARTRHTSPARAKCRGDPR